MIDSLAGFRWKVASRGYGPLSGWRETHVSRFGQAVARWRRASTSLRRASPPTVLRKSAIVLGSGTGA